MYIFALVLMFVAGVAVGGLIVFKLEENAFDTMHNQTVELEKATREAREEREEYRKTRAMLSIIDNVPEYLRDKYNITTESSDNQPSAVDEDDIKIYI